MASSAHIAGNTDPASCAPPGLGDVALFIGGIEGEHTQEFIELNKEHIWTPPPPCSHNLSHTADDRIDDEQPEPWRGEMRADIPLDSDILCHSFLKPPKRSDGWHHGAMSKTSTHTDEKPRDTLYPLNTESGISSSTFRIGYTTGPRNKPVPRLTPLLYKAFIHIQMGKFNLKRTFNEELVLTHPAKIHLPGLSYWLWVPRLNWNEEKVFSANIKAFYHRANCLDEEYFPGSASTNGDSTLAPTPMFAHLTRTGRSGTVYEEYDGKTSKGTYRRVFPVKVISHPRPGGLQYNGVVPMPDVRLRQFNRQPCPPELKLVAKEIHQQGDGSQSAKKNYREMLENEWRIMMNNPHPHVNAIIDIAYVPGTDDPPWLIEEYQPYCLADEHLPIPVDVEDMLLQLLSGLKHYHDNNIMHRDIKPANVVMQLVDCADKQSRWVYKFTDHGEVRRTDRRVEGLAGTPFFCAPEVLDKKPYNERADIFSLGVLFLEYLADHEPFRDRPLGSRHPTSSPYVQRWMNHVDPLIERKCDPTYQPLLRGMLLRSPLKRWSASKCLAFLNLDPSETPDRTILIGPMVPWAAGPLTEAELQEGRKRKYAELELDNGECGHVEPDGVGSDDASTAKQHVDNDIARLSDLGDVDMSSVIGTSDSRTYVTAWEEVPVDAAPATPKASCATQMPVTPCQGAAGEDELPSVPCTPVVDDKATVLAFGRVVNQPEVYDFTNCDREWDWDRNDRGQFIIPHTRTGNRVNRNRRYPPPPGSEHGDTTSSRPSEPAAERAGQFMLPKDMTESKLQIILDARGHAPARGKVSECPLPDTMSPGDYVSSKDAPPEASLVCEADTEASTRIDDAERQPEKSPFSGSKADSEALTEMDCGEGQPEALPVSGNNGGFEERCGITGNGRTNTTKQTKALWAALAKKDISWGDMGWLENGMGVIR